MEELIQSIRASFQSLPSAQRAVAEYIVEHYQDIPFQSVTTMAKIIGVSDTTIIKYCMQMGFAGFGDFKRKISDYVQSQSAWHNQLKVHLDTIKGQDAYSQSYLAESANVQQTLENAQNRDSYEALLCQLEQAKHIYVAGFRSSSVLARYFSMALGQQGYPTIAIVPGAGDTYELMTRIGAGDLLISFCFSRYFSDAVDMIEYAVGAGAKHIAFTDSVLSPSAAKADWYFLCKVESYHNTPSLTSSFALLSAILAGSAQRHPEAAHKHMTAVEEYLLQHKKYYPV